MTTPCHFDYFDKAINLVLNPELVNASMIMIISVEHTRFPPFKRHQDSQYLEQRPHHQLTLTQVDPDGFE